MKDKRVIIIGGSGFLGHSIATYLKQNHYNNVFIGDIQQPKDEKLSSFLYTDLLDFENVLNVVKDFDIIINCAGQITNPINKCLQINTVGIHNLVNVISRYPSKKLIHISTVSVYGTVDVVSEDSLLNPETPYASIKAFAEFIIQKTRTQNYVILRIPNLYGPNQKKGIIAYLHRSLYEDKKLNFNNNGDLVRHYLHIDDCSLAIVKALEKDINGVFNIPALEKKTVIDLIKLFEKIYDIQFSVSLEKVKPFENIAHINFDKFKVQTGFLPEYTIETYLKQMINNGNK